MTFVLSSEFRFETTVRLGVFAAVFIAMAIAESALPRRVRSFARGTRWPANFAIAALGIIAVRILIPVSAVGAGMIAQRNGLGALNWFGVPRVAAILIAVVFLDLAIYAQHVVFHAVPFLWRIHRMHHADLDFDVTTGFRFHPAEIVISMIIKIVVVIAIGAAPIAVLIFEVLLNATSMFNHGNLALPEGTDRWLRWLLVTPDMHRVHHSIVRVETNSNFGFNLPWWDWMMWTYRAQPAAGHIGMTIGIEQFRSAEELGLMRMLSQPLREDSV